MCNPICPFPRRRVVVAAAFVSFVVAAFAAPPVKIDVPAQFAPSALLEFSKQAGVEVLFSHNDVKSVRTNSVRGEMEPEKALRQLLAQTGFGVSPNGAGKFVVTSEAAAKSPQSRDPSGSDHPAAPPGSEKGRNDPNAVRAAQTTESDRPVQNQIKPTALDAKSDTEKVIELSPFEVSSHSDEGYAARETLAGTRFKSELKDTSAQVSIMTKEFLQDIASVTMEDAYRYSANIENLTEFTQAANDTSMNDPRLGIRIRGLTAPGLTHDFFRTALKQDSYNTERLSISSGPNAILFGNGNPGGIVDIAFLRPNLQRPKYQISFRNDNYNSIRGAVDLNQPLVKDRLGLRLAAVKSHQNHWRKPAGRDDNRFFGTIVGKPFSSTTVRAYYENAVLDEVSARNVRVADQVTPWINAGRPAFNNGLVDPSTVSAANSNNGVFARNTFANNVWAFGSNFPVPYMPWGSAATANITSASTPYSVQTIGPGNFPHQTGIDSYSYVLPYDGSISPFDVSVNGNGWRLLTHGEIWGFSFEQQLPANLFFQADFNRERARDVVSNFLSGAAIRGDANMFLPDRVTPNPNLGRYYVEGNNAQQYGFRHESLAVRAMLSYELDLTGQSNWRKWLGRHRIATMYLRTEELHPNMSIGPRIVPPTQISPQGILDNYGNFGSGPSQLSLFNYRTYLSDPADSRTGNTYYATLPFDPARTTTFAMPNGYTYAGGDKSPYGGGAAARMNNAIVGSRLVAMQNFFLKGRLVTNVGWRSDAVRTAEYLTRRKTTATSAFESIFELEPPKDNPLYTSGATTTIGAIGHVLPWLSIFYNQSSTWNPPSANHHPMDGSQIPGPIGDGKDYGVMLRFLANRVSFRLNKYQNTSGPSPDVGLRGQLMTPINSIELTLAQRAVSGEIPPPPAPFHYDPFAPVLAWDVSSDQVSKGYEAELVINPTRNWRLALNGSHAYATRSNIGKPWIDFIQARAGIWADNASLQGPDSSATTVGTRYLGLIQTLNLIKQSDGQRVEQGRSWRANLVARYAVSEGKLRGAFVGGGYRWRSKAVLAYRLTAVDNAFPFAGAPAQLNVPALNSPIMGEPLKEVEAFLGYSRRLGKRVSWRVQLNVRNLFDDRSMIPQRANMAAGFVTSYDVPEPRSFILSNTFSL